MTTSSLSAPKTNAPNTQKSPPNKQVAALASLNADEIRILSVFAVVYEGINQTTMQQLLNLLGWRNAVGKKLSQIMEKALRAALGGASPVNRSRTIKERISDRVMSSCLVMQLTTINQSHINQQQTPTRQTKR